MTAEYQDTISAEYSIDEGQAEWQQTRERERHRERRRQLLMRYPQMLVYPPAGKYFAQAEEEDRAKNPPFRERLKTDWKWWLYSVVLFLVVYTLAQVVKAVWKFLMN